MWNLVCFWGLFSEIDLCLHCIVPFNLHLCLHCLKIVTRSKQALTSFNCGLQNSSNFPQILSKLSASADKHQDTYWSIPKSPHQAITFWHFCHSGSAASSHSRMFSLQKPVVEIIIHCPIHLGTFYVWHEHVWCYLLWPTWMERKLLGLVLDLSSGVVQPCCVIKRKKHKIGTPHFFGKKTHFFKIKLLLCMAVLSVNLIVYLGVMCCRCKCVGALQYTTLIFGFFFFRC